MKLTILGTGNAMVTECYNTCFIFSENHRHFLVDGGGGNTILRQLSHAGIPSSEITDIFVTHKHVDHIMGIVWMIRMLAQNMQKGVCKQDVHIYAHEEVIHLLATMADMLLQKKQTDWIGKNIHFIIVEDKEQREILGHKVTFFDIHSTKAKQFGFQMQLDDNRKLTCCGDEPSNAYTQEYVHNSDWLMHEAFCLYEQADIFHPYEKHHSTVKEASELAQQEQVKHLLLYHTEDKNIKERKALYTKEAKTYFTGEVYVPEDLECFEL